MLEFAAVGPDDEDNNVHQMPLIPRQVSPEQDLQNRVKLTNEAGTRKVKSVIDVMENEEKMHFILEDLWPDTGLVYFAGLSGTGKTILAIQTVGNIVLGQPTLSWRIGEAWHKDFTAMFLSLEMGEKEFQLRLQHMYPKLTEEQRKDFASRFLCYTEPEPFELWNPVHVLDLTRMIKSNGVHLLLIDSASVSFAQSLKDDAQVNESIKNLYMLRSRLNLAMGVVAHTRKPSIEMVNNPENVTLNELFGHSGVAQSASSIIIMLEDEAQRKATIKSGDQEGVEKMVHIVNAKSRFGANSGAFVSRLSAKSAVDKGEPLMFRRNAIPIAMTDEARRKAKSTKVPSLGETLKGAFADLDFGSELGGEE